MCHLPWGRNGCFREPGCWLQGAGGLCLGGRAPLSFCNSLSSQDLTPGSVEEAEEAEPDEEFKDAIEVGGPSLPLSTDQAGSQLVWSWVASNIPNPGFSVLFIQMRSQNL